MKSVSLGEGLIDSLLEVKKKRPSREELNPVTETLICNPHSHLGIKLSKEFQEKFPCSAFSKTGIWHFSIKFCRVSAKVNPVSLKTYWTVSCVVLTIYNPTLFLSGDEYKYLKTDYLIICFHLEQKSQRIFKNSCTFHFSKALKTSLW